MFRSKLQLNKSLLQKHRNALTRSYHININSNYTALWKSGNLENKCLSSLETILRSVASSTVSLNTEPCSPSMNLYFCISYVGSKGTLTLDPPFWLSSTSPSGMSVCFFLEYFVFFLSCACASHSTCGIKCHCTPTTTNMPPMASPNNPVSSWCWKMKFSFIQNFNGLNLICKDSHRTMPVGDQGSLPGVFCSLIL